MTAMRYLWQPGRIGPMLLPHRVVMGAMHMGLEPADPSGAALARFYAERAEGGAGLIVTGGCAVSQVGAGGASYSVISDGASADALAKIPQAVHAAGAKVLLQLFHAGRYAHEEAFGLRPVAPSAVYSTYSRCEPRALTASEITETVADFARAARGARELGFDGVEIMGSEGYLLSQFMAPLTNLREDEWGGDSERRMRFPLAVARAVREALGPDHALVYRFSGADLVDGGATLEEVLGLASRLASGPADALNVGIGWHESRVPTVQSGVPKAAWAPWARAVRATVASVGDVPVIMSNRVNTAALADALIGEGFADFVSMARPFLADPLFVAKSRATGGALRGQRVNRCIACNQCIDQSIFDQRVSCAVNPRAGYELERERAAVDGGGAAVAVVGGGPAGMEAARALAVSGFGVALFEAAAELGGQFRMARRIPGKEDFGQTGTYFAAELERLAVDVHLGEAVEGRAGVRRLRDFDAVVVATGVHPRGVALEGVELPHVLSYSDLLLAPDPRALVGERVVIIGAGGIGSDIAHMLCAETAFYRRYGLEPPGTPLPPLPEDLGAPWPVRDGGGRRPAGQGPAGDGPAGDGPAGQGPTGGEPTGRGPRITLMRRHGRIGDGIGPSTRWVVVQELKRAGVELLTGVEYERIEPDAVVIRAEGERRRLPADTVVIAAGQEPESMLAATLARAGRPHFVIGGAANTVGLDAGRAFREGFGAPAAVAALLGIAPTMQPS